MVILLFVAAQLMLLGFCLVLHSVHVVLALYGGYPWHMLLNLALAYTWVTIAARDLPRTWRIVKEELQ